MRALTQLIKMIGMVSASFYLTACSQSYDIHDLQTYIQKLQKSKDKIQQKSLKDEVKIPTNVIYQANNLREPFQNLQTMESSQTNLTTPLASFPLNSLRFIGTLKEENEVSAYVLTPDNMLYQVKVGDVIGNRYGKIVSITLKEIKIEEQSVEDGKMVPQVVTLQLKDDSE